MPICSFGDKKIFMRNTKNYTSWKVWNVMIAWPHDDAVEGGNRT
jgi:hypothetical protein